MLVESSKARNTDHHRSPHCHRALCEFNEALIDRIATTRIHRFCEPVLSGGIRRRYRTWGLGRAGRQYGSRRISAATKYSVSLPLGFTDFDDPLTMASWGVNRITESGRVAAPEQRISVHGALRAITIESASWRREYDLGSITVGKQADFTVLEGSLVARLISQGFVCVERYSGVVGIRCRTIMQS